MQTKTLLLAETTREQSLPPQMILRAAKGLEADLALFDTSGILEDMETYPGCSVRSSLKPEDVWLYQAGIFLNPGLKTLSKLAHVIIDDRRMEVLYEFLVCEEPLFFPCIQDNPSLWGLPAGLRKKAGDILEELQEMGVQIIRTPAGGPKEVSQIRDLLITEEKVSGLSGSQVLQIRKEAVLTPLAQDLIRIRKIQVIRR